MGPIAPKRARNRIPDAQATRERGLPEAPLPRLPRRPTLQSKFWAWQPPPLPPSPDFSFLTFSSHNNGRQFGQKVTTTTQHRVQTREREKNPITLRVTRTLKIDAKSMREYE